MAAPPDFNVSPPDLRVSRALHALAAGAFTAGLATDVSYWSNTDYIWVDASDWLVSAGVIFGFIAFIALLIEFAARRRSPFRNRGGFGPAIAVTLAWAAGVVNMFVHSRDGWTSVVPEGLALSLVTVVLLFISVFLPRARQTPAAYATPVEVSP